MEISFPASASNGANAELLPCHPGFLLQLHMKTKIAPISDDDHDLVMILIYSLVRAAQHN